MGSATLRTPPDFTVTGLEEKYAILVCIWLGFGNGDTLALRQRLLAGLQIGDQDTVPAASSMVRLFGASYRID